MTALLFCALLAQWPGPVAAPLRLPAGEPPAEARASYHSAMPRRLALWFLLSLCLLSAASKPSPVDFTLTSREGQRVHLRDYRGKIVVLNFWATWCVPCRHELPLLLDAEKRWSPQGVVFIAASLDDKTTRKDVGAFVEKHQIRFPVWLGATPDLLTELGLGDAVPDTVILNEDGLIFARFEGELRREELDDRLAWITGDRKSPPPPTRVRHLGH